MRSLLGGKGAERRRDDAASACPSPTASRSRPRPASTMHAGTATWPDGLWRGDRRARSPRSRSAPAAASATRSSPLLVSVRSGAVVLDAGDDGHDPQPRASTTSPSRRWPREPGDARFAWDSYRRFLQMFGEVVDGRPGARLRGRARARKKSERGVQHDTDLDGRRPARARRRVQRLYREEHAATTSRTTRASSCAAPSTRSSARWENPRAARLPARERHPGRPRHGRQHHADGVRQPRRDARRPASASRATRRPASKELYGEFLLNAQGEDVVAGIRTPRPIARARRRAARRLRRAARDDGAARAPLPRRAGHRVHGRARHALPAADAHRQAHRAGGAADRARPRGRGRDRRATRRCGASTRRSSTSCCTRASTRSAERERVGRGLNASPGAARRRRRCSTPTPPSAAGAAGESVVLVRWETTPDDIHGVIVAQGVLTAHGGMTSRTRPSSRAAWASRASPASSALHDRRSTRARSRVGDDDVRARAT